VTRDADALRDEVALLRRSLEDARAEHARGELDDDAIAAIEQRDEARLKGALERLAAIGSDEGVDPVAPAASNRPGARRSRRLVVSCTLVLVLAAATIGVVLGRPFAAATPPLQLNIVQKVAVLLVQAELFVAAKQDARAITAYDAVLRLEPRNAEALIESGWLRYESGILGHEPGEVDLGAALLARAVALAPRDGASHLYYGIVLLQHFHDPKAAKAQVIRSAALPESKSEESITSTFLYYFSHG
jgi:hypothetical protein